MKNMINMVVDGINNAKTKKEKMELQVLGVIMVWVFTDKKAKA